MLASSVVVGIEEERYRALLRVARAIATSGDCSTASEVLVEKLDEVSPFHSLHLVAFDKGTGAPCWSLLHADSKNVEISSQDAGSIQDSPLQWVRDSGQALMTAETETDPGHDQPGRVQSGTSRAPPGCIGKCPEGHALRSCGHHAAGC